MAAGILDGACGQRRHKDKGEFLGTVRRMVEMYRAANIPRTGAFLHAPPNILDALLIVALTGAREMTPRAVAF
jgi:hypothetical protein